MRDVVVIGYGTTTRKDATGSLTSITSKDFNKGAIVSADQLLTGKAPGVRITNNGGQPDSSPNIRIRGGSSLSANSSPLIVIDGVPVDNTTPAGVSNPLSLINPNDIESFTVLKDASATAIYGSRASNGVIIITTKKGIIKLHTHMSKDSVKILMGRPESTDVNDYGYNGKVSETWKYRGTNRYVDEFTIEFVDGKLKSVDQFKDN